MKNEKENKHPKVDAQTVNEPDTTYSGMELEKDVYVTFEMRQSIDVLFQAVEMAREKGIYGFKDAGLIGHAIDVLTPYSLNDNKEK